MRKLIFLIIVCLGTACCTSEEALKKEDDYVVKEATLVNQLPVDGCDWHFGVDLDDEWGQFVPDSASKPKVDALIKQAQQEYGIFQIRVKMKFRLTGQQQEVLCGWNQKVKMDEISIASIEKL